MSETKKATIPQPREGLLGEWDRFVGPGAARGPLSALRRRPKRLTRG